MSIFCNSFKADLQDLWFSNQRVQYIPRNTHTAHSLLYFCGFSPFHKHGLTLIPTWISNYIHYNGWEETTYPFPNFNGGTVEVCE